MKIGKVEKKATPAIQRDKGELRKALDGMKVNESRLVEGVKRPNLVQHTVRAFGSGKYAIRAEGKGFRVWRLK